jgi:type III restriction enzyme
LVPHTDVVGNSTLAGLAAKYTRLADTELLTRYELSGGLGLALQA